MDLNVLANILHVSAISSRNFVTASKEISHLRHQLSSLNDTTVALLHVIPVDADTDLSISCIGAEPLPSVPKSLQSDIHAANNEEPHPIQLSKLQKCESDFLSRITYSVKDVEVEVATRANPVDGMKSIIAA